MSSPTPTISPSSSSMNLQRTSTYNLACDFKENIEEVEANWEAELQHLQKNKKARDSLQEKLRILHVLLSYERETTSNMEQTLKEKKAEVGIPDFDNSNLSDIGSEGLSSASAYSEQDLCLVFNPSSQPNVSQTENRSPIITYAADGACNHSDMALSQASPDPPTKASRSAHWRQLVASFLSHPNSIRASPGTRTRLPLTTLGALTESNINVESTRRRLTFHASSSRSRDGLKGGEAGIATVNAAGGKFTPTHASSVRKSTPGGRF